MQLYTGMTEQFIEHATHNELAPVLREAHARYLGYSPGESEVRSWNRSLRELAYRLESAAIERAGIVVEYRLPQSSKRLDAMIVGPGDTGRDGAVIVELKQWERAFAVADQSVEVPGYTQRAHQHPSAQAGGYADYLRGTHTAFYSDSGDDFLDLSACSYLHDANSHSCGDLLSPHFAALTERFPLFTQDMIAEIEDYLRRRVGRGDGGAALDRVRQARFVPSQKLLGHVAEMVEGNPVFTLLDEQAVALDLVLTKTREMATRPGKAVVLVTGGPGTGKSVIAMRAVAALAKTNTKVVHATGSKAFTTNLRAQVGNQGSAIFKYFNSFSACDPDEVDVLIADEAHRLRKTSNNRFTKADKRSKKSQIEELIDVSRVALFLLDDNQVVRPEEIGTPELIRETAAAMGADFWEVNLREQFRCSGSDSYLRWLDWLFELGGDLDMSWHQSTPDAEPQYDVRVFGSPGALDAAIRQKVANGESGRLVAGFCWKWSDPRPDDSLVDDVVIGEWRHPWNRKERGGEPPARHPATVWATQPVGLNEVGCIYTAQGFEFDYCGVIVGPDLVRRDGRWVADKAASHDSVVKRSKDMLREVLNAYRVLASRGIKGTYFFVADDETRRYLESSLRIGQKEG